MCEASKHNVTLIFTCIGNDVSAGRFFFDVGATEMTRRVIQWRRNTSTRFEWRHRHCAGSDVWMTAPVHDVIVPICRVIGRWPHGQIESLIGRVLLQKTRMFVEYPVSASWRQRLPWRHRQIVETIDACRNKKNNKKLYTIYYNVHYVRTGTVQLRLERQW